MIKTFWLQIGFYILKNMIFFWKIGNAAYRIQILLCKKKGFFIKHIYKQKFSKMAIMLIFF